MDATAIHHLPTIKSRFVMCMKGDLPLQWIIWNTRFQTHKNNQFFCSTKDALQVGNIVFHRTNLQSIDFSEVNKTRGLRRPMSVSFLSAHVSAHESCHELMGINFTLQLILVSLVNIHEIFKLSSMHFTMNSILVGVATVGESGRRGLVHYHAHWYWNSGWWGLRVEHLGEWWLSLRCH